MTARKYTNYTLAQCDAALAKYLEVILSGQMTFWQKFTCEKCWARIQVDQPNTLFTIGHCQECGHFTDLQKTGCNYSLLVSRRAEK